MLMEKSTEIVLCCELSEQGLSKSAISRRLGRDRETIRFWLHGVEQMGLKAFLDKNATASQGAPSFASGRCSGQDLDLAASRTRA